MQSSTKVDFAGIPHKNLGIPKIGDKRSAYQARFHSSPINRLPNLVLKLAKFGSSKLIQLFQIFGYLVIRVTRIFSNLVIWVT